MEKVDIPIVGSEINISYVKYKKKEKPINEFIEILKEDFEYLEHNTNAYLLDDFSIEDEEIENELEMEFEEKYNNYLNLKDDEFAIVYYYIYADSEYSINNIDLDYEKDLILEHKEICDYYFLDNIKQKDNDKVELEFIDSSGDAYPEVLIVDKNNCIKISADIDEIIEKLKEKNFI